MQYYTTFSEYRRGRYPGDFTARNSITGVDVRVEGGQHELSHRNRLLLSGNGNRSVHSWNVIDLDTGKSNQEICSILRCVGTAPGDRGVSVLRHQTGAESYYRLKMSYSAQQVSIEKVVGGTGTTLGSPVSKAFKSGGFYVCTFRANSTTLSCKVWAFGDTEPGGWDISLTDSTFSDGYLGLQAVTVASSSEQWECYYLSAGTNGDSAYTPSSTLLSEPMDSWISEPDEEIDIALRFEYYDPSSNTIKEEWYSTYGRTSTAYSDFPSSTKINQIPSPYDLGSWSQTLQADAYLSGSSGESSISLPSMTFSNVPDSPA